nr:prenyltransferase/squalene oxidase repeat-containing protein [uncultured Methanobacterium sp.]
MNSSADTLKVDPIPVLISCGNPAIEYFTRQDILNEKMGPIEELWKIPSVLRILKKQENDGSWKYPGKIREDIRSKENYDQLETYRILGGLVEKYGLNKNHHQIQKVSKYFFSCQTPEGDFRGIYGNQYAPTYSSAIMELLIKAGYGNDKRIKKGFQWLLSMRQDDGGWIIPFRTSGMNLKEALLSDEPNLPDRSRPFSHLVTGMVLRAFAAHPEYRKSTEAQKTADLLTSRLFLADKYPDRKDRRYWERVSYPFWFTDIISALDSLSFLGFKKDNHQIQEGLRFLIKQQTNDGLFDLKIVRGSDKDLKYWICLTICRLFKRYGLLTEK